VLNVPETLAPEQYEVDHRSSHGGIAGTLMHIIVAHEYWLARWLDEAPSVTHTPAEVPAFADAKMRWKGVEKKLVEFIDGLTDEELARPRTYKSSKGEYSLPLWQAMQHLANHSTYHRGQITTMLRQMGVKPAATDLIVFYRGK
jgi:uncharacterized damage-inducible protein DinB